MTGHWIEPQREQGLRQRRRRTSRRGRTHTGCVHYNRPASTAQRRRMMMLLIKLLLESDQARPSRPARYNTYISSTAASLAGRPQQHEPPCPHAHGRASHCHCHCHDDNNASNTVGRAHGGGGGGGKAHRDGGGVLPRLAPARRCHACVACAPVRPRACRVSIAFQLGQEDTRIPAAM